MDDEERERQRRKYIKLRNKLYSIKTNVETLESKTNELVSTLESGFKINKEIAEKESINTIISGISNTKDSISNTIRIANRKI